MGCERSERQESPTLPHGCLLSEAIATFGCTLTHKQPHPSPPLLSQGREQIAASHGAMTLKLVPLSLSHAPGTCVTAAFIDRFNNHARIGGVTIAVSSDIATMIAYI